VVERRWAEIGQRFGLHSLALEDVVHTHQRAKVEAYGDHLFIATRAVSEREDREREQFSLFAGEDFVVSFQEYPGDAFEPVRERIRRAAGRIRTRGPDYLTYALLDSTVDRFFPIMEQLGDRLEELERAVYSSSQSDMTSRINHIKWELLGWRRAVWPLREAMRALMQEDLPVVQEATHIFFRDCADHVSHLIDLVEAYSEMGGGLLEMNLALASHRMNEVMKLLTMIATIFIPLGFVAGLYGMNFDPNASRLNMPELGWGLGYPAVLVLMLTIASAMVYYFYRRGWLSRDS
jgi:magnesium transporter